jgi:hypothetical protein
LEATIARNGYGYLAFGGDCRQFKVDADSYNDAHADAEQIQVSFDSTMDLAEMEAAEETA